MRHRFLVAASVAAVLVGSPGVAATPGMTEVTVGSWDTWIDSHQVVPENATLIVVGSGTTFPQPDYTPAGPDGCLVRTGFPTSKAPCWSLIGRVGNGVPFFVGSSYDGHPGTGRLYLGMNDEYPSDNSGTWSASVMVGSNTARQVTVQTRTSWTDTGVNVPSGGRLRVNASGKVSTRPDFDGDLTPDGCFAPSSWPAPGVRCWALAGRFGTAGSPFQLGRRYSERVTGGPLYLVVNEGTTAGAAGSLTAAIRWEERCPGAPFRLPVDGYFGWTWQEDEPRVKANDGHPIHTGVDVWGAPGALVYPPAKGVVKVTTPGKTSMRIWFPDVNGGSTVYLTHVDYDTTVIKAGATVDPAVPIGTIHAGMAYPHVHLSVGKANGAYTPYDDNDWESTQDPSPYFAAHLNFALGDPSFPTGQDFAKWAGACTP